MNVYEVGCRVTYIGDYGNGDGMGLTVGDDYKVIGQCGQLVSLEGYGTRDIRYFKPYSGTYKKDGITTTAVPLELPVESTGFKDPRPYQTTLTITEEEVAI